jgi:hydroxymethylpyrimidine/phosphomethylpyrimidine kinase
VTERQGRTHKRGAFLFYLEKDKIMLTQKRIPKRILTIAGSDSGGGAGIQADIKTITLLGGFAMSAITALTAQNTLGVQAIQEIPADFVVAQIQSVLDDIGVDAVKTGMLPNEEIIRALAAIQRKQGQGFLVVDPVLQAKGGTRLVREEAIVALKKELVPLAFLVTPNLPEAECLVGGSITTLADMREAACAIRQMGPKAVIIKGGHLDQKHDHMIDILWDGRSFHELAAPRLDTRHTHGTGCTFAAALATFLAQGMELTQAAAAAKSFITEAIRQAFGLGKGHGPTNHFAAGRKYWQDNGGMAQEGFCRS